MSPRWPLSADQLIGWLVAALLAYGAVHARVAVLESRQTDVKERLVRIEEKLDVALGMKMPGAQTAHAGSAAR